MAEKLNRLDDGQRLRLWDWLREQHREDGLEGKKLTEIATAATAALSVTVTEHNIRHALGVLKIRMTGKEPATRRQLERVAAQVAIINASLGGTLLPGFEEVLKELEG